MSGLRLRKVTRSESRWRQWLAAWTAAGMPAGLEQPGPGVYLSISADDQSWQGFIDPRQWLAWHSPQLAALAQEAVTDLQIQSLAVATPQPLTFDNPLPGSQTLVTGSLIRFDRAPAPCVYLAARECTLWLTHFNLPFPAPDAYAPADLPLTVEWVIGVSSLPAGMSAQLATGDVLLITRLIRQVKCQGRFIGYFSQQQGTIRMNFFDDDEDAQFTGEASRTPGAYPPPAYQKADEHYPTDAEGETRRAQAYSPASERYPPRAKGDLPTSVRHFPAPGEALGEVPLTLEFILQRRYLTLREIGQFRQGKVLEMEPDGEKHIEIRANGHLLALGELVQLEDRLGVELMELSLDNRHDQ